jgi:hypothetical protein
MVDNPGSSTLRNGAGPAYNDTEAGPLSDAQIAMLAIRVLNTPVKIKPVALIYVVVLWAGLTWAGLHWHPGRTLLAGLCIGFVSMLLMVLADFGHPFGHVLSARVARAPMDEIVISGEMPRTLYLNNDVPAQVHVLRATGGPLFNLLGLLLSLAVFGLMPPNAIGREIAFWSALAHGLMLPMSLAPLPMVDGGSLLKWTLVLNGKAPSEADLIVRGVGNGLAVVMSVVAIGLLLFGVPIAGGVLLLLAMVVAVGAAGLFH